jgi:hypothetical protein
VEAGLSFGESLDEQVTTDGDGKFKEKTVTGANSGGFELSVGGLKYGSSGKDQAKAEIGASGDAAVDVNTSTTDTNRDKWLEANVPFAGDHQDEGTLARLGAEKQDTDDHDISGMKLKGSDLSSLGYTAVNDWGGWMSACPSPRLRDDWAAAGRAIKAGGGSKAAVAEALARFVGSGGSSDVVYAAVRSAGDVSGGSRYEFPGGLAKLKPSYDSLVIADSELGLDALAQSDGKDKAISKGTGLVGQLDSLHSAVANEQGFTQAAVQAEMLAAINDRREKVKAKLRVLNGGKADVLSPQELVEQYNQLLDNCIRHKQSETDCFAKIEVLVDDDAIETAKLIKQLRDMYAVWNTEYDEMAALAQENGFGKDIYWKYKPDTARFNRSLTGAPGPASVPQPETEDKRKKPAVAVAQASSDPVGDSIRQVEKQRVAQGNEIYRKLDPSKNKAYGAGNRLYNWIHTDAKAMAIDAHNRGMVLLHSAERYAAKVPKNATTDDFTSYGFAAVEDFSSAASTFAEGLALYPAGSPPKKK